MQANSGRSSRLKAFDKAEDVNPTAVATDEPLPDWAVGVVRSRREGVVNMRGWNIYWRSDDESQLSYAQVPGATLVKADLSQIREVGKDLPEMVLRAIAAIGRLRKADFELGVIAYAGQPLIRPDVHTLLAATDIMLADPVGEDVDERAENFVRSLRLRSSRQRRNFRKYVQRVTDEREAPLTNPVR